MTPSADAIMDGHQVSVVLEPDPDFEAYLNAMPAYLEAYSLPHLTAVDDKVWGATRRGHGLVETDALTSHLGFVYTNALDLYVLYNAIDNPDDPRSERVQIKINSARQYRTLNLVALPQSRRVWHNANAADVDTLASSIRAGHGHRIAWRDQENRVHAHPLDLTFLFSEDGTLEFRVEAAFVPSILADPGGFSQKLAESVPDLEAQLADPSFGQKGAIASINTFRIIGNRPADDPSRYHVPLESLTEVAVFAVD